MFLAELRVENFRMFGDADRALVIPFGPGLTALVGENDSGKSTVVDAIRLALGTRDQEFLKIEETDFYQPSDGGPRRTEIRIRCKFKELGPSDVAAFVEYLTYESEGAATVPILYVNCRAAVLPRSLGQGRFTSVETRSGKNGDGPQLDSEARALLYATYLRPLRDAERALSAGRGSRLSQILQHAKEVTEQGVDYNPTVTPTPDPSTLSVLGIADYANALLGKHQGIRSAQARLNADYLTNLSFSGDQLSGTISVSGALTDAKTRLRQLLEKLELELRDQGKPNPPPSRGLGSNNLLFMACELLLLGSQEEAVPLLLIEEPEAHLHPQRQLRLMQFLQEKAKLPRPDGQRIQIIVTTHSPNLASAIDLENLVLLHGGKVFPLAPGFTNLDRSDYGFLQRFLDVTKANMFFARGLVIVEGDAENILMPTLARLVGKDFTENGVSVVNVGGTGLRRFSRVYQRKAPEKDGTINVPVACVTDLDVMPDCAPAIIGKVRPDEEWPDKGVRRWRAKSDFSTTELNQRREEIRAKASGQRVETFVADEWTFEFDLASSGLAREVWLAAHLAKDDQLIRAGKISTLVTVWKALHSFEDLSARKLTTDEMASHVYSVFTASSSVSKATAAQYLGNLLERRVRKRLLTPIELRALLPRYLVEAIDFVTQKREEPGQSARDSSDE